MKKNKNLQERIIEEPIILDYAKQENKRNWKRLAIYGGISVVGGYILYQLYDLYSTLRAIDHYF